MTAVNRPQGDPSTQGYVPVAEWPAVTTMIDGFGKPSLPASDLLAGRELRIILDDNSIVTCTFTATEVEYAVTLQNGESAVAVTVAVYRAVEVRASLIFVDFVLGAGPQANNVSLLIDLASHQVTHCESFFVDRDGALRMKTRIRHGAIEGAQLIPRERSSELVGKRIYYRYSPDEHYEHVYLNSGTFVWHCVRGGEVGLADADPVHVFAIEDGLVLLHWSETVMPVESIVAIDLENLRSIGRMFCWDGPTLQPVRIPFDSHFEVLSEIKYPTG